MEHRHDIDGLRGIAVLGVIAFHFGAAPAVSGGFTGVDIFLVLSGFLITANLASDLSRGQLSVLSFYERRIRRIVPALLVVLAFVLAFGWFILVPGDYASLGTSAAYSAFGLGNIFFYGHTGYFDRAAELQPLLHTWSLGVEEQFYFVWPAVLWLAVTLVKSERWRLWLIAAGVAACFAASLLQLGSDPKAAYYLMPPRAWELAVGSMIVFLPLAPARCSAIIELIGAGLIFWGLFAIRASDPFPGTNALFPCIGAALLVWPKQEIGVVGRLLTLQPLRWTGWISYSLYLWHWPLLVLFCTYKDGNMPNAAEMLALLMATFALSYLTWRFVERPIRAMRPVRWGTVAVGLASCATIALLSGAVAARQGFPERISPEVNEMRSLEAMWEWTCPGSAQPATLAKAYCTFGARWEIAKSRAILIGDSHAEHMAPIIEAAGRDLPTSFMLHSGCPAALGGHARRIWSDHPDYVDRCVAQRQQIIRLLHDDPSISLVILSASWSNLADIVSQDGTMPGNPDGAEIIAAGLDELVAQIANPNRRVVIIADVPQYSGDPAACAIKRALGLWRRSCSLEQELIPKRKFLAHQKETYDLLSAIASRYSNVAIVRPGEALCKGDWCEAYLNGEFLYRDGSHLRRNLLEKTREDFARLIGLTPQILATAQPRDDGFTSQVITGSTR